MSSGSVLTRLAAKRGGEQELATSLEQGPVPPITERMDVLGAKVQK